MIIGAGAVGGAIGGLLAVAGNDVVLVARGDHLEAIRADGLHVATPAGSHTAGVPAVGAPDELELHPDDVLVLAVKSQDTTAALTAWSERPVADGGTAGERLLLVCAQNGVENERAALRRFDHVAGMCVWLPATYLDPGRVSVSGHPFAGVLTLGHVPPGRASRDTDGPGTDPLDMLAGDLEAAGFLAPVVADVMSWKYAKLLSNLGNAVDALCRRPLDDDASELHSRAMAEGRTVLAAAGVTVVGDEENAAMRARFTTAEVPGSPRGGGSTWQSLTRGTGSTEADYLNGEVVLLGRLHGVPTPVNALLQRLTDRAGASGSAPGSWVARDLLDLLPSDARVGG